MYDDSLYTLLLNPPSSEQLYRLCWLSESQELHAPSLATLQDLSPPSTATSYNMLSLRYRFCMVTHVNLPGRCANGGLTEMQDHGPLFRLGRKGFGVDSGGVYTMEKWVALARGMPSHLGDDDYDVSMLKQEDIQDTLSDSPDTQSHIYHLSTLSTYYRISSDPSIR